MNQDRTLNEEQKKAVEFGNGPLLIIAGAGTGKTTVITERVKHLILKENINPSNILALTFTEKAAAEMEDRIDQIMPYGYSQMWIETFHAFCDRILRNEALNIGLNPNYRLMTESQSVLFLEKNIAKLNLDYFRPLGNPYKFVEGMLQHFSRLKDEDVNPQEYYEFAKKIAASDSRLVPEQKDEMRKTSELASAYKTYEELKAHEGVMDFSDLISNTLKLFRTRKNILKQYQNQFKYILVDEFQDTNYAQNQLAILLAGEQKNITVVGDDDQAIYRWRGAAISNMIQFRKQFPKTTVVTLTKNYRSTEIILNKSYNVIQNNNPDRLEVKEKIDKRLKSERKIKGNPIELILEDRAENEADEVAKQIKILTTNNNHSPRGEASKNNNYSYRDIAILVRANDHSEPFTRALSRHGIPYQFLGPGRLFQQEEIKDLIAYLKVLYNFDDSVSLYRVLNMALFEINARDIAALLNFSRKKNKSLFQALEILIQPSHLEGGNENELFLNKETIEKLKTITDMIHRHLKLVPKETAGQILYYFFKDSGLLEKNVKASSEKEVKVTENTSKFFEKLKNFEAENKDASIFAVVDWIDLAMQMGESPLATNTDWTDNNAVNILTIHSSKGLEFPVVFLVNLVAQRFPSRERREQVPIPQELIKEILPQGDFHLQEERRLFYVGMTRARDQLFLTAAKYYGEGKRERKLSPFTYEALGEQFIEKLIERKKEQNTIVQPSLLDWANSYEQKNVQPLATNHQQPVINYLSYSQLQTFEMCPLHYKLQYVLKLPKEPVAALTFGTTIHATLRDYHQLIINKNPANEEILFELLEKNWINEGYKYKDHEQSAKIKAKEILELYLKSEYAKPDRKTIAVEQPFIFPIRNEKRILKLGGRIDRIDLLNNNSIEIIDYKTGNPPKGKDIETDLQLTFYALAATEVRDAILNRKPEDITLSLYYLESEEKLSTTRTREQLEVAKQEIFQKVEEIEQSNFTCNKSIFCSSCEYHLLCN